SDIRSDIENNNVPQLFNSGGDDCFPSSLDEEIALDLQRQEYERGTIDNRQNRQQDSIHIHFNNYNHGESMALAAALESEPNHTNEDYSNLDVEARRRYQREREALQNYGVDMSYDPSMSNSPVNQQRLMHGLSGLHNRPFPIFQDRNHDIRNLQQHEGDFGAEDYETLLELDEQTDANKHKLNEYEINQIPTGTFKNVNNFTTEENTCSICFDTFEENQILHYYRCTHKFHKECSARWLLENNVCPICRVPPIEVERPAVQHRSPVRRLSGTSYNTNNNRGQNNRRGRR
ncbi:unnamed protein product, partial [Didymodactylos carnosus]